MSLSQQKIPESKSKSKFQSLNINNLYQGAANKPQSKGIPQKHGLQSLGKVPTARRAPANLPSVKSEKGGNDPTVVLVPTGGGWASKDGEGGEGVEVKAKEKGGEAAAAAAVKQQEESVKQASPSPPSKPAAPLSWAGTVTGGGQAGPRQTTFLHQKSPLFGQEFPSLAPGEIAPGVMGPDSKGGQTGGEQTHQQPVDPAYGPGPSLRPQAFANWSQGGKVPGGPQTEGGQDSGAPQVQPHKPVPPQAPQRSPATNQYKSIMPGFMEALELPAGPPARAEYSGRRDPRGRNGVAPRHQREARSRPQILANTDNRPSIIDAEKLQRMDNLDNGDDWAYEDDDFDYNKKLESEEEDNVDPPAPAPQAAADPNWADQVPSAQQPRPSPPQQPQYNFYDEFKQKGGVGFGVDEEEKRRNKKSEEVMKNIERARQRREEEENRYRRGGGGSDGGTNERDFRGDGRGGGGAGQQQAARQPDRDQQRRRNFDERGDRGGGFDRERNYDGRGGQRRDEREDEGGHRGWQGGRADRGETNREASGWERDSLQQPFDLEAEEKRRSERPPSQARSPGIPPFQRALDQRASEEREVEKQVVGVSPTWGGGGAAGVADWVEDVEAGEGRELYPPREKLDYSDFREEIIRDDRPNRPHSRDSTLSKESRGSKEGKGSRSSRDREIGFGMKKEEKAGKADKEKADHEVDNKKVNNKGKQQQQPQDLRGFFQGGALESEKKGVRQAPGPITRERLEQVEAREQGMTTLTQLKKREPGGKQEDKVEPTNVEVEKTEVSGVTLSLIDPDLLENISDEEENFDASEVDKNLEAANLGGRGGRGASRGGGGRGGRGDGGKFAARGKNESRVERGAGGGGRGGRGGRGEGKGRGGGGAAPNRWNEAQQPQQVEEEDGGSKGFGQPAVGSQWGFLPRGQPSRRGRGAGGRQDGGRGGGATRVKGFEDGGAEEIGEWGDDEMEKKSGGGRTKVGGRGKGKKEGPRPGSGGGEEGEEWETASETSLEEREKRSKAATSSAPARGGRANGGRGGRGQGTGGFWEGKGRRGGTTAGGSAPGGQEVKEGTPEPKRVGPSIDNFDLSDHAGVAIVDDSAWSEDQSGDFGGEIGGDFMQVVNKKTRGGMAGPPGKERERRPMEQRMGERGDGRGGYGRGPPGPEIFDKKMSKTAYDRRQSKLPPRLAKQREVSRAQARGGPGQLSPGPSGENGWPEGDKMGVFSVEPDLGTGAWEKPLDTGVKVDNGAITNSGTLIFENTAFKGGKAEKMDKGPTGGAIQLPLSFSKQDNDNGDLKLDFTFGGEEGVLKPSAGTGPPLTISRSGLPASPSTDDLQTKLAGTKKLWDQPGMATVPENSATGGCNWNEADVYGEAGGEGGADSSTDKTGSSSGNVVSNVAKVKPRQAQNPPLGLDGDTRASSAAMHYNRMAVPSPPGNHSGMPPSHMPPSVQPWAFMPDRTSPMYNPYGGLNQQSILMPGAHSMGTDLFNSNNGGFRSVPTFPGSGVGLTTTNNVLISQASLINSHGQNKQGSGIGPIGSKAGGGGAGSPYLTSLPNTNSNIFIQHPAAYDSSGNPLSYLPGSAPHPAGGRSMPQQTAFYHQLNRLNQQQAYNALQGFAGQQHALSQQQMRASAVAGLPFMKTEQAKSPVSMDSGFQAPGGPYNAGRGAGVGGGPPSPKTKMKMAQQQEQAKMNANLNNLNLNANLNANVNLLAQMQMQTGRGMGMGQYGHIGAVVPGQYNPSPIARPQVSEGGQPGWGRGYSATPPQPPATQSTPTSGKQMNQYFSEAGADASEEGTVGEKTGEAAEVDAGVVVDAGEGGAQQDPAGASVPPPEDTPA